MARVITINRPDVVRLIEEAAKMTVATKPTQSHLPYDIS